jgi:hypothetical protein
MDQVKVAPPPAAPPPKAAKEETVPGGYGPDFPVTDMPESPIKGMTFKKMFLMMGPAVIALGGSIGGGEWLVGPSLFVKYGLVLLWVTTVSTTLQTFLNLEMTRYTLATGEPITLGFMRLAPGKAFWGILFTIAGFLERGLPGWALAAATAVAAIQLGRLATATEQGTVVFWGFVILIVCGLLVSIGGKIEKTLEIANWVMVGFILIALLVLDLFFAPASTWAEAFTGYVSFGVIPAGVDILLLGALVGYSAYGGFGNNCITNWYRDKGYGMAAKIGYIASAVGGKTIKVSPSGMIAKPTAENMERFKGWWKMLNIDQWGVFWFGGMIGMLLPGILYVTMIPRGTTLPSWGLAVSPASGMIQRFGPLGLYIVAFIGFWVLFSTAVSNLDLVPRQTADMLWYASERVRKWSQEDLRKVYYFLLIAVVVWAVLYLGLNWASSLPIIIFAMSANIANFTMALSALLTIIVNRKFLPKEMQAPVWREVLLLVSIIFFGLFFSVFVATQFLGVKLN